MAKDINLLPTIHKPKPITNIWQVMGLLSIGLFMLLSTYYIFNINFKQKPQLTREIETANKELLQHQWGVDRYKVLKENQDTLSMKSDTYEKMLSQKEKIADIFRDILALKPEDSGFSITGSNLQENGTINIYGKAVNTKQVNDYIANLNDSVKGKVLDKFTIINIKNENGVFNFNIGGKIKKGSGA